MSHSKTLNQIAEILSFTNDTTILRENLNNKPHNWDAIVKLASQHLVLPTLYYRLKYKELLHDVPEELEMYLYEIASINKNRNLSILKEINEISLLFNANNISHVFLKGAAFIASDFYDEIGERMTGDIDILVAEDQLEHANRLLIAQNYIPAKQTFGAKYFEHKHLPRLRHNKKLAAVELHKKLLIKPFDDYLSSSDVLKDKRIMNQIYVPSPPHLLYHNALNYQINDKAYSYLNFSFRSAYDSLVLLKTHPEIHLNELSLTSHIILYYKIIGLYFDGFTNIPSSLPTKIKTKIHQYKSHGTLFYKIWNTFIKYALLSNILIHRFFKFIMNSNYRNDVISNRSRILKNLKG